LLPEGTDQSRSAAHPAQRPAGVFAQLAETCRAEIGQLVLLPVRPQVFDGIQFRGVARKELYPNSPRLLSNEVPHRPAPVRRQSIPDDQQPAGYVMQQMGKKKDDLRRADGAGKQTEVEVPPGYPRHGRKRLPVEVVLQHRRLTFRRPSTAAVGPLAQSTLVDEDDGPAFVLGFFLISGQHLCFHSRIFSSSRSSARPVGRWQLQPNCRKIRQACEG